MQSRVWGLRGMPLLVPPLAAVKVRVRVVTLGVAHRVGPRPSLQCLCRGGCRRVFLGGVRDRNMVLQQLEVVGQMYCSETSCFERVLL